MPGITFDPGALPLARPSTQVAVYRYDPTSADAPYELLPNVVCLAVQQREGPEPPSARFRYVFGDPLADSSAPQRFEQVYPLDAQGDGVVLTDDRLVVQATADDGSVYLLFDGFVQVPQADLDAETETVSFVALAAPVREWDSPIAGALARDASNPMTGSDVVTDLPTRFNPDGKPNATPKGADAGAADGEGDPNGGLPASGATPAGPNAAYAPYPTFLGPFWPSNTCAGQTVRPWTLGMAARYLIAVGNPGKAYVTYDDLTYLDDALSTVVSTQGDDGPIDMGDPSTFTYEPIPCQDFDATGEAWPEALAKLIEPHGFTLRFELSPDSNGDPLWRVVVYRKDDALFAKDLTLQTAGSAFDPGQTNLGSLALARDAHDLYNAVAVDARPGRFEASFVLAPGFAVAAGDATAALSLTSPFKRANTETFHGANLDKYRRYVVDEAGLGHWDFASASTVNGHATSLDAVLGKPGPNGVPVYATRPRPALDHLVSTDDKGDPLRPQLYISFDYAGPQPGVWDGSGTWQLLETCEWRVLDDALGVLLTMDDPNAFTIQARDPAYALPQLPGAAKINLVEWTAAPTAAFPVPKLMLLAAVQADQDFNVVADRRPSSPTRFTVTRRVDARDRFKLDAITPSSYLFADAAQAAGAPTPDKNGNLRVVDDTAEAQAYADALRRSGESGAFAGSATIPRLTTAYTLGDKIQSVDGRDVSLRSNVGAAEDESPIYPSVVGLAWHMDGAQTTTLELSDLRASPPRRRAWSQEYHA